MNFTERELRDIRIALFILDGAMNDVEGEPSEGMKRLLHRLKELRDRFNAELVLCDDAAMVD